MDLLTLKQKMDEAHYIYDDTMATVLAVALQLGEWQGGCFKLGVLSCFNIDLTSGRTFRLEL